MPPDDQSLEKRPSIMLVAKSPAPNSAQDKPQQVFVVVVALSLSRVQLSVTPGTVAHQASLSFTISQSLFKLISIESEMPSNHLMRECSAAPFSF